MFSRFLLFFVFTCAHTIVEARDSVEELNALYKQYDVLVNPPVIQKWGAQKLTGLECIQRVPDVAKPRLPGGFIWSFDELGNLRILKHQCVAEVNFNIYVFGPDAYGLIQFIVCEEGVPIHGFAMTRRGSEFPETLRSTFPMLSDDYKRGILTKCRGHIIDYKDTLGSDRDVAISTLCAFNYKPEPWGYWARTLRTQMVAELRRHQSSYAEYMFYSFFPEKTNNKTPIPAEVLFVESPINFNTTQSYLIPETHECHTWEARDISMYQAKSRLRTDKKVHPFIWDRQLNLVKQKASLGDFFRSKTMPVADFCDLYLLMVAAETEYSESTLKMTYLSYAAAGRAPLSVLTLWLNRSVLTAQYIDDAYHSAVPPFQMAELNTVKASLLECNVFGDARINDSFYALERIHDNVLYGRIRLDTLFIKDEPLDLKCPEIPVPQSFDIDCSNTSPKAIESLTPEIESAVLAHKTFKIRGLKGWQMARKLDAMFSEVQTKYPGKIVHIASYEGNVTAAVNDALSKYRH